VSWVRCDGSALSTYRHRSPKTPPTVFNEPTATSRSPALSPLNRFTHRRKNALASRHGCHTISRPSRFPPAPAARRRPARHAPDGAVRRDQGRPNPDCLLFYRMGDFYELFFDDAEVASRALGIVLTKRGKHRGQDIPVCGVPVHRADLHRLIARGHRVSVRADRGPGGGQKARRKERSNATSSFGRIRTRTGALIPRWRSFPAPRRRGMPNASICGRRQLRRSLQATRGRARR
jgi:MutS-like protein